ncbi:MAG: hypothetical protein WD646_15215 [Actinomycetota bacterium]
MAETRAKHETLADGRWGSFSLMEQLGNVGSEVGRATSAKRRGDDARMWSALERALELIDLTIADPRWIDRLKEPLRARELICDFLVGDNEYGSTGEGLDAYFLPFAIAARSTR